MLQERADKICEMANVMQKSIQIDEENMAKEQELMARLVTENKVSPFLFFESVAWFQSNAMPWKLTVVKVKE